MVRHLNFSYLASLSHMTVLRNRGGKLSVSIKTKTKIGMIIAYFAVYVFIHKSKLHIQ